MHSRKLGRITEYILPALVAGLLFAVALCVNGLWPFGSRTVDYYDMAQQAEAYYYHNFDQLHGIKSFVFDWYTNLGRGIPGLSEPSLYDLLLYVIPRGSILEAMSVMMMIRIMASAFFMGLFIKYVREDLPYIFRLMISAGYGLCGFILVNYTIPQWLDMASIVPLVLLFSQKALRTGKILGLSLSVFAITVIDTYFAIQMLMFIFLIGGAYYVYVRFSTDGKNRIGELYIARFACGIMLGLALSAFSAVPDIVYSLTSARFSNGTADATGGAYTVLLQSIQPAYLSRWFALLSLALPAAVVVTGSFGKIKKKEYRTVLFYLTLVFIVCAQLFLESIHLILHFGSYVNYPVRNGYMIYCVIAGIAAASYNGAGREDNPSRKSYAVLIASVAAGAVITAALRYVYVSWEGITDHDVLMITMGFMAVCAAVHVVLIRAANGRFRDLCAGLWMAELLFFATIMIGKPLYISDYGNEPEQSGEYIRITDSLVEGFGDDLKTGPAAATERIKNPDTSLNTNYGMIMRRETLSGWTSLATQGQISGATDLGYSSQFTRLLDSGGNIFSDTILHITDVVSLKEQDEKLYEKVSETEGYTLYKNRFRMPFAIPVKDASALPEGMSDIVDLINSYAKAFGSDKTIASYVEGDASAIQVKGNRALYFTAGCVDCEYKNTKITVNGRVIPVPSITEEDNVYFPAHFNNHTVPLGTFNDEDVNVVIEMDESILSQKFDWRIYEIDTDALKELCDMMPDDIVVTQGKRSLDIKAGDLPEGCEGLLIPVPESSGWSAEVNGVETNITGVNGLFMYVPLSGKDNTVHMSYFPPYMKTGIVLSLVSALVLIVILICDRKRQPGITAADRVLGVLYGFAFAAAFIVIYLIPAAYAVIHI